MSPNPLPPVPAPKQKEELELASVVRPIILAVWMFGILNIAREVTYLIGSVQSYGAPQFSDITSLIRGVIIMVAAFVVSGGLRRLESWARRATLIGGSLWTLRLIFELMNLLRMRATGDDRADVQIVIIGFMVWALIVAIILLLIPKVSSSFVEK